MQRTGVAVDKAYEFTIIRYDTKYEIMILNYTKYDTIYKIRHDTIYEFTIKLTKTHARSYLTVIHMGVSVHAVAT